MANYLLNLYSNIKKKYSPSKEEHLQYIQPKINEQQLEKTTIDENQNNTEDFISINDFLNDYDIRQKQKTNDIDYESFTLSFNDNQEIILENEQQQIKQDIKTNPTGDIEDTKQDNRVYWKIIDEIHKDMNLNIEERDKLKLKHTKMYGINFERNEDSTIDTQQESVFHEKNIQQPLTKENNYKNIRYRVLNDWPQLYNPNVRTYSTKTNLKLSYIKNFPPIIILLWEKNILVQWNNDKMTFFVNGIQGGRIKWDRKKQTSSVSHIENITNYSLRTEFLMIYELIVDEVDLHKKLKKNEKLITGLETTLNLAVSKQLSIESSLQILQTI